MATLEKTVPPDRSYEVFDDGLSDSENSEDPDDGLTDHHDSVRGPMHVVPDPDVSTDSPDDDESDGTGANGLPSTEQSTLHDHQEGISPRGSSTDA